MPKTSEMNRVATPALLTVALLMFAAVITYYGPSLFDAQVYCVEISRRGAGCSTHVGDFLQIMWGIVVAAIVVVWIRYRNV